MAGESLSLRELNQLIQHEIYQAFPSGIWVVAEISEATINPAGHCYLELIEKDLVSGKTEARMRATIWSSTFRMLRPYFENATGYRFGPGLKILFQGTVEFHKVYGISINIKDIDPSFSLGELARRKLEVIRRLKAEGVLEMNGTLDLPLVPQNLAVISSETAAGYGDFTDTLVNNPFGFRFQMRLFPALMQGEKAEQSVIDALDAVYHSGMDFDLVIIIRGGGAQADLDCFNQYELAYYISQFPIPVFTGIGHERDETVADLVAHTHLKTPTAVAEYILDMMKDFLNLIDEYSNRTERIAQGMIFRESQCLDSFAARMTASAVRQTERNITMIGYFTKQLESTVKNRIKEEGEYLSTRAKSVHIPVLNQIGRNSKIIQDYDLRIIQLVEKFLQEKKTGLQNFERNCFHLNPERILERGYSITLSKGCLIKDPEMMEEGDEIESVLNKGRLFSKVFKR